MRFPTRSAASRRRHNQSIDNSALNGPLHALELAIRESDLRKSEGYRRGILPEYPTFFEHGPLRILVSASPTERTLSSYIHTLTTHNVVHVVRVCEPYYDASSLTEKGFVHHHWPFNDGENPPDRIVQSWLHLLDTLFNLRKYTSNKQLKASGLSLDDDEASAYVSDITTSPASSTDSAHNPQPPPKETIAIHCAAGLGRAPVLVALALVEAGLDPVEAVGWLRALRRGAINGSQLAFLHQYQPRPPLQSSPKASPKSRSKLSFFSAFRHSKNIRSRSASDEKLPPVRPSPLLRSSPASSSSQKNLSLSRLQLPEGSYILE